MPPVSPSPSRDMTFRLLDLPPEIVQMIISCVLKASPRAFQIISETCRQFHDLAILVAGGMVASQGPDTHKYCFLLDIAAVRVNVAQRKISFASSSTHPLLLFMRELHEKVVAKLHVPKDKEEGCFEQIRSAAAMCLRDTWQHSLVEVNNSNHRHTAWPPVTDAHILAIACSLDDVNLARAVFSTAPELPANNLNNPFMTPWNVTISRNSKTVASLLLQRDAKELLTIGAHSSLLARMASLHRLDLLVKALEVGSNYSDCDKWGGWDAMEYAAIAGHLDLVKIILGFAPPVGLARAKRLTLAADRALRAGRSSMARFLLSAKGADLEAKDTNGGYCLINACLCSEENSDVVLERVQEVKEKKAFLRAFIVEASFKERLTTIKRLLDLAADTEERLSMANEALQCATVNDNGLVLKTLLDRRLLPISSLEEALLLACDLGSDSIVDVLTDFLPGIGKISPATLDKALWTATKASQFDIVMTLLHSGANINSKHQFGLTALQLAVRQDNATMVELLLDHGADFDVSDEFHVSAARYISREGADPEIRDLIYDAQRMHWESDADEDPLGQDEDGLHSGLMSSDTEELSDDDMFDDEDDEDDDEDDDDDYETSDDSMDSSDVAMEIE